MSVADFLPAKRAPGRKNRRAWCRGKPGVPHTQTITVSSFTASYRHACGERAWRPGRWLCWHIYACAVCGKHIARVDPANCPDRQAA